MITPLPNAWQQKPGSATFPFFGVVPVLLDEKGHEVKGEGEGYLCIKQVRQSIACLEQHHAQWLGQRRYYGVCLLTAALDCCTYSFLWLDTEVMQASRHADNVNPLTQP